MPTAPNGDTRINSVNRIGFVASNAGVGEMDSRIGAKEIETKTEITTNRM